MDSLITLCTLARNSMGILAETSAEKRNQALKNMAELLERECDFILKQNALDLEAAQKNGMSLSMQDRLRLTKERIYSIASGVREVIDLPDPLGLCNTFTRDDGLVINKTKVPFGLVAMIFEARPNVTADAASLAIKSGNAVVLRGGKEAINSNIAIAEVLRNALESAGIPKDCIQIIRDTSRETATQLMKLKGYVDLLIPRGGKSLIRSVVENATVPVIETGAGNCHVFFDESADVQMALDIIDNAKRQRPSVCNACEKLLVHKNIAAHILPLVKDRLNDVELRGCEKTREILSDIMPASPEDWLTEYNDLILSVKIVDSTKEAVEHINTFGTKHSEAIVTRVAGNAEFFCSRVDAAAVYVNASTRFTDGNEFGLGAEIGISTQKLHARGPMGLEALTTVKYLVNGNGNIRR